MKAEDLPTGFTRRPSGSLRVQIRIKGHEPVVRNFPLFCDDPEERRRQMATAQAWASRTRLELLGGYHVSTRLAESTTLRAALERFEAEVLKERKPENVVKERYRIRTLSADPIADMRLAQLRPTHIAALRDRLLEAGWAKRVASAAAGREREAVASSSREAAVLRQRAEEIRMLPLRKRQATELDPSSRERAEAAIAAIEAREGIRRPARTTITNVVQLVSRAAKHMSQYMDGVPVLTGTPMPKASPGRERRPTADELELLLSSAPAVDPRLPLIVRLAIATALRRERILGLCEHHLRPIGQGRRAIAYPRETRVNTKRTGIVPVTAEIDKILCEAVALRADAGRSGQDIWGGYSVEAFKSAWRRLMAITGIADLHFHDLRHEATSRFFESGLTTAEVMSITGHSTTDMVDRYSHYAATLVLSKLEKGLDAPALLEEISFLVAQFRALGGETSAIRALASSGVSASEPP